MIVKAALLLFRNHNDSKELMFVQPRGKDYYVFPGGKQEENETIVQALTREIQEELSTNINNIDELGIVVGQTPEGRDLEMHLFTAELLDEPKAASEIIKIYWLSREFVLKNKDLMTPMTLNHVMPFLGRNHIW